MIEIGLLLVNLKDVSRSFRSVYTSDGVLVRGVDLNLKTDDILNLKSVSYKNVTYQTSDKSLIINPVLKSSEIDSNDSNNIVKDQNNDGQLVG